MTVRVVLSIGEDYPHLFVSTDPDEVNWADSPAAAELLRPPVVIELSDEDWTDFQEAENRYRAWLQRLDALRSTATIPNKPAGRP